MTRKLKELFLVQLGDMVIFPYHHCDFVLVRNVGHVAASLGDSRMLIYGGRGQGGKLLSDTWIYDVISNDWNKVPNASTSG
jgi:hypothetical protein